MDLNMLRNFKAFIFFVLWFIPIKLYASIIESSIGAAVVNDATAYFYNPAALALLKNTQVIGLNSNSKLESQFQGQFEQLNLGITQSGSSITRTHYTLPSFYLAVPTTHKVTLGLAIIS